MNTPLRLTMLTSLGLPLAWLALHTAGIGAPPSAASTNWDDTGALSYFQGGRGAPGPGRGGDDRRKPPHDDEFGRPDRPPQGPPHPGGPGGPPPRPGEGRPPHGPGGGRPAHHGGLGGYELEMMRQIDPEMAEIVEQDHELERTTYKLADAYRYATEEKQQEIRSSLTEVVQQHFEVRQNRRELELARLEAELERLRESIESRRKARQEIVQRRIAEVLGDDKLKF